MLGGGIGTRRNYQRCATRITRQRRHPLASHPQTALMDQ